MISIAKGVREALNVFTILNTFEKSATEGVGSGSRTRPAKASDLSSYFVDSTLV
jgi:hypothetical protein